MIPGNNAMASDNGLSHLLTRLATCFSLRFTFFLIVSIVLLSYSIYTLILANSSVSSDNYLLWKIDFSNQSSNSTHFLLNATTTFLPPQQPRNRTLKNRLFCLILSTPGSFKSAKAFAILNAWGHKCDNYRFVSKIPIALLPKGTKQANGQEVGEPINLLHPADMFEDVYAKLTYKMFYTIKDVYLKYIDQYEWFLKADLDTFVNVENLKDFLQNKDFKAPVTYGYDYKVIVQGGYQSGGAGYVLSYEAFRRIGEQLAKNMSFCHYGQYEDVDVHTCLRKLGVYRNESLDEKGRERFHMISLKNSFLGNFMGGQDTYAANPLKKGYDCCSDGWTTFHYVSERDMVRLATILSRHKVRLALGLDPKKPTFKTVFDEYMLMERVEDEMGAISKR